MSLLTPDHPTIRWLLDGDVAIQYQVYRDLLGEDRPDLQARIATEGWGSLSQLSASRRPLGTALHQPKWISSHYTLLDLRYLYIAPDHPDIRASIGRILAEQIGTDGGINPSNVLQQSDVYQRHVSHLRLLLWRAAVGTAIHHRLCCWACKCPTADSIAVSIVPAQYTARCTRPYRYWKDSRICPQRIHLPAGGCCRWRLTAANSCATPPVQVRSNRRDHQQEIPDALVSVALVLRYFACARLFSIGEIAYDDRMQDAIDVLLPKQRKDGTWPVQARHPGQTHFDMEQTVIRAAGTRCGHCGCCATSINSRPELLLRKLSLIELAIQAVLCNEVGVRTCSAIMPS